MKAKPHAALFAANSPTALRYNTEATLSSTSAQCLFSLMLRFKPATVRRFCLSLENTGSKTASHDSIKHLDVLSDSQSGNGLLKVEVRSPSFLANLIPPPKLSLSDQAFFLLAIISCTAMQRAAISLSKLADTAREEIPSTMAAIRLSGMEISDLILELSDMSQEIADGVKKSALKQQKLGLEK